VISVEKTVLLDGSNNIPNDKTDGIYFCFYKDIIFIPWDIFFQLNEFFKKKIPYNFSNGDRNFRLESNIFNIFFLKFIAFNIDLYETSAKLCLIGNNGYFGIYNSFSNFVGKTVFNFYFSFAIGSFILMNCVEKDEYIEGKLFPWLKWNKENNSIHDYMNEKIIECPSSFKELSDKSFGLRKKTRQINKIIQLKEELKEQSGVMNCNETLSLIHDKPNNVNDFLKDIECQYCITLTISNEISTDAMDLIQDYIGGTIVVNGDTMQVYFPCESIFKIQKLMDFIDKWEINNNLDKCVKVNNSNYITGSGNQKTKFTIHILSEIYFLVFFILLFLPKFMFHISNIDPQDESEKYIQMNYKFTRDEINVIWGQKNSIYQTKKTFLKALFLKTLSVFMSSYAVVTLENDINSPNEDNVTMDIYPLSSNLKNEQILKLYSCNEKAYYSKKLLSWLLNKTHNQMYAGFEIPIVIINLVETGTLHNISVEKLFCNSENGRIPIIINVIFNQDTLLNISLSYKKKYSKLKYVFNEFIQQLLE
jgi:hypothetical protein